MRKRWLRQLLARRSAPAEVARFVARQLLTMPEPLRLGLAAAHARALFADVAGHDAGAVMEGCGTCPPSRLPLLMLAPVVVAYEGEMCGADASRRGTWRADRYSPCPRVDAGRYLAFLASVGYPLAVIEQAVADGVPYTGDTPAGLDLAGPAATGTDGGEHALDGPDHAGSGEPADPGDQDGAPPDMA